MKRCVYKKKKNAVQGDLTQDGSRVDDSRTINQREARLKICLVNIYQKDFKLCQHYVESS